MRICHISDLHGYFPPLYGSFDVVVATGDLSPNYEYDDTEVSKQMYWWEEKVTIIKAWLQNHPFLFTLGNHDFINGFWLEDMLQVNGINAVCLHDRITTLDSVNFYGFPYIPPINGKYAFECVTGQMNSHLDRMAEILNSTYVDVIAAHCPPYGFLDLSESGIRFGNTQMNSFLDYKLNEDMQPSHYLTGHIHQAHGLMMRNGMFISNAATFQHILEI